MRKPIFIYGAGGLGREVLAMLRHIEIWEPRGFLDDGIAAGSLVNGLAVIGGSGIISSLGEANIVVAVGNPLVKRKIVSHFFSPLIFPTLIHPSVNILDSDSVA